MRNQSVRKEVANSQPLELLPSGATRAWTFATYSRQTWCNQGPKRASALMVAKKELRTQPGLESSLVASALPPWAPLPLPFPPHTPTGATRCRNDPTKSHHHSGPRSQGLHKCLSTPDSSPKNPWAGPKGQGQDPSVPFSGPEPNLPGNPGQ